MPSHIIAVFALTGDIIEEGGGLVVARRSWDTDTVVAFSTTAID